MLWELLRETFDVDSRILNTFRLLLIQPGQLAVEFSRNRRASYISPIRLYLFISLGFFFLLSSTSDLDMDFQVGDDPVAVTSVADSVAVDLFNMLDEERTDKVHRMLAGEESGVQQQAIMSLAKATAEQSEPVSDIQRFMLSRIIDVIYQPREALSAMIDNLPIAMFFLLPVFALILQLLYIGSHKYYVEHLVFATHLHSFAFLVYALMLVLPDSEGDTIIATVSGYAGALLWFVLLIYHFKALRRYYSGSFRRTCAKYFVQMAVYFLLLIPTSTIAVMLLTLVTV
ncbi:MAG: DUF3667 domain-containing protein [Pseudomonadales bacterium]|jgi:hypothetical protein|nr:DUF3667 domain-containing protein [Pseudomonadales bacterium]